MITEPEALPEHVCAFELEHLTLVWRCHCGAGKTDETMPRLMTPPREVTR